MNHLDFEKAQLVNKTQNLRYRISHLFAQFRENKELNQFIVKYVLPFVTIIITLLIKYLIIRYVDSKELGPFALFIVGVLIHSWAGGFKSGMLTFVLSILVTFAIPFYNIKDEMVAIPNVERTFLYALQIVPVIIIISRLSKRSYDIRHVNERIALEKRRLKDIIDSLFTMVLVISPQGKIIEANDAVIKLGNKTEKDLINEEVVETYPWAYSVNVQHKLETSIVESMTGKTVTYDEKIRIAEGEYLDVQVTVVPVTNFKGEVEYLIMSATDISKRKEYEKELELTQQSYLKLLNSNIIGMVMSDKDGNVLEVNDAFLNLAGYSRGEIKEKNLNWYSAIKEESEGEDNQSKILNRGLIEPIEKDLVGKDGKNIPIIISGVVIDEDEGTVLCLVVDISERKKLEQKKDEFISIASHELKTPLTTLKGYVQLLDSKLQKREEENTQFVTKMDKQLIKLTELINDLLDISRIQSGDLPLNKAKFNIIEMIEDVVQDIVPIAAQHRINLFKPSDPQIIDGDKARLSQVITNLLTNAIKYSPDADKINVYIQDYNGEVRIMVEDFGIGIPRDKIENLFQKFYRIEENQANWHQGLGLGLYISNEIIKKHGSEIEVKSEEGKGSIFYFNIQKGADNE